MRRTARRGCGWVVDEHDRLIHRYWWHQPWMSIRSLASMTRITKEAR